MPYDLESGHTQTSSSLREEVLDLMSRRSRDPSMSDQQYIAALKSIVRGPRPAAEELWDSYHAGRRDVRSATYASFGY